MSRVEGVLAKRIYSYKHDKKLRKAKVIYFGPLDQRELVLDDQLSRDYWRIFNEHS